MRSNGLQSSPWCDRHCSHHGSCLRGCCRLWPVWICPGYRHPSGFHKSGRECSLCIEPLRSGRCGCGTIRKACHPEPQADCCDCSWDRKAKAVLWGCQGHHATRRGLLKCTRDCTGTSYHICSHPKRSGPPTRTNAHCLHWQHPPCQSW